MSDSVDMMKLGMDISQLASGYKQLDKFHGKESANMRRAAKEMAATNKVNKDALITVTKLTKANEMLSATYKQGAKNLRLVKVEQKALSAEALLSIRHHKELTVQLNTLNRTLGRVSQAKRGVAKNYVTASKTMTAANKDMILSAKGVERVLAILLIRRGFHYVLTNARAAVSTFTELHKSLYELRTIAQDNQSITEVWADSIFRLSDAWDLDVLDVANAQYEILSNQIAKGVVQVEAFSNATFEFAKVAKTSATDSVNLLTAKLNAYNEGAGLASDTSAKFFKIIELGRIRAGDMANTIGKVLVPAKQLGIVFEEVGAAIATITIQGVKGTETMTLLRGVMMKLMKPTDDMKKLFAEWGVATGEQAIATYGLWGVLVKLEEATRGSASELANLFGRIRATMGVAAMTGALETYESNLDKIVNESLPSYAKAIEMTFQTSGEIISKEMNKVKNHFTKAFGGSAVSMLASYSKNIFSLSKTIAFLVNRAINLGLTMATIWAYGKVIIFADYIKRVIVLMNRLRIMTVRTKEQTVLLASIKSMGIAAAIYVAIEASMFLYRRISEVNDAIARSRKSTALWLAEQESAALRAENAFAKVTKRYQENNKEMLQSQAALTAWASKLLNVMDDKWVKEQEKSLSDSMSRIKSDVTLTLEYYKSQYSLLSKEATAYAALEKKLSASRETTLKQSESFLRNIDKQFQTHLQQVSSISKRIRQVQNEQAQLKRDDDYDAKLIANLNEEKKLREEQIQLIAKAHEAGAKKSPQLRREITNYEKLLATIDSTYDSQISKAQKEYNIRKQQREETKADYKEIAELWNQILRAEGQAEMSVLLGGLGAGEKVAGIKESIKKHLAEIVGFRDQLKQQAAISKYHTAITANTEQLAIANRRYEEQITASAEKTTLGTNALDTAMPIMSKAFSDAANSMFGMLVSKGRGYFGENETKVAIKVMSDIHNELLALAKEMSPVDDAEKTTLTFEKQAELIERAVELQNMMSQHLEVTVDREGLDIDKVQEIADIIDRLTSELIKPAELAKEMVQEAASEAIQATKDLKAKEDANDLLIKSNGKYMEALDALAKVNDDLTFKIKEGLVKALVEITDETVTATKILIHAAQQLKTQAQGLSSGGTVYASAGKYLARGTDVVPTMLTPGEMIVNQKSTQAFYGVLQRINSGLTNQGQNDYSTHVGDINVSVNGGATDSQTVRSIGTGIRREIARGRL